jgi:hypothetical protein
VDSAPVSLGFVVDGLGVELRGFRKSHHLIPGKPATSNGIAAGNHARGKRTPGRCVGINKVQR